MSLVRRGASRSPVGLGDALELVLLLGGVDQLVGQALGDRLDVPERGLAGAGAQQPDGLQERERAGNLKEGLKRKDL